MVRPTDYGLSKTAKPQPDVADRLAAKWKAVDDDFIPLRNSAPLCTRSPDLGRDADRASAPTPPKLQLLTVKTWI